MARQESSRRKTAPNGEKAARWEATRPTTMVDHAVSAIISGASRGVILPGDRIVEADLVKALGISRVPIREALRILESQGVVTSSPYKGIRLMDVTHEVLEQILDVRSTLGAGTTFIIRLPLTLAIMSSLLVRIHEEFYALPLDHIDEIVEIGPAQIHRLQGKPVIEIRKRIIPLVNLGNLFLWGGRAHPALASTDFSGDAADDYDGSRKRTVVVVQNGETTIGLVVDQLIGMQEVVLKSLEKNFRAVPGLSGASILGDGRVSLILDVDAVIQMAAGMKAPQRKIG